MDSANSRTVDKAVDYILAQPDGQFIALTLQYYRNIHYTNFI
jgi:hypothetical protein